MNEPEAILPPRCCGHELTMAFAGDFLEGDAPPEACSGTPKGFRERYLELLEIRTPDPIFCSTCKSAGKNVFIPPEEIEEEKDLAMCSNCHHGTCTLCKKPAPHGDGRPCDIQGDEERQDIRYQRLSGRSGWRRCDRCGMMVSRDAGCSHVVCRFVSLVWSFDSPILTWLDRCGQDVWLAF
jgi:hypothetical protein